MHESQTEYSSNVPASFIICDKAWDISDFVISFSLSRRHCFTILFYLPLRGPNTARSRSCSICIELGYNEIRFNPCSWKNVLRCKLKWDLWPITGLWILASFRNGRNMFVMYSKNISPVIQPVSDFPMPQPGGAALTKAAGILPYLKYCKVRGPFT